MINYWVDTTCAVCGRLGLLCRIIRARVLLTDVWQRDQEHGGLMSGHSQGEAICSFSFSESSFGPEMLLRFIRSIKCIYRSCVNQQKLGAGLFNNLRFRTVCENVFRKNTSPESGEILKFWLRCNIWLCYDEITVITS